MITTIGLLISSDEPSYGMEVGEDNRGFYTRLKVVRSDALVSAEILHGPSPIYSGKIPPMFVPSPEGENPVGLMMEMSEAHRQDLSWYNKAQIQLAGSTLISDAIERESTARSLIRNRSVFGPQIVKQRNGYSSIERDWNDRRAAITHSRSFPVG